MNETLQRLYDLTMVLPRFNSETPSKHLVQNGIYLFYETGETILHRGEEVDRIVRVGTHKSENRFRKRVRQHYRNNKNGSVFRRHLGGALLAQNDPGDPRIPVWMKQKTPPDRDVEAWVSSTLAERFTFSCFAVETERERLDLERGLIALLAQHASQHSDRWLGHWAVSPVVRRSSLWNTQQVDAGPLTESEFERLERAIRLTLG